MGDTINPRRSFRTKKVQPRNQVQYFGAFGKKAWVAIFRKA